MIPRTDLDVSTTMGTEVGMDTDRDTDEARATGRDIDAEAEAEAGADSEADSEAEGDAGRGVGSAMGSRIELEGDALARKIIRDDLDHSLLVEAAAGTGKTTELIERILSVLESGRGSIENIVAVTFTRKAAGELKLRLREALDTARARASGEPTVLPRLERALSRLEEAHIGTIHSFCGEILRERPIEAGIDPLFEEIAEGAHGELFGEAFSDWFEEQLAANSKGLFRVLARRMSYDTLEPLDRLKSAAWLLTEWRDFSASWQRPNFDRAATTFALVADVLRVAEDSREADDHRDGLYIALEPAREFAAWWRITHGDQALPRRSDPSPTNRVATQSTEPQPQSAAESIEGPPLSDHELDAIESRLFALPSALQNDKRKGRGHYGGSMTREDLVRERASLIERLVEFRQTVEAELASILREELRGVIERYQALKRKAGKLDFMDLLITTRDLLLGHHEVRRHLQSRYSHIFVDEFQDTDPLQTEILLLLAAEDPSVVTFEDARPAPGKLFVVGDPKQSIYRFRRADVLFYRHVADLLVAHGVKIVRLSRSFRATAPLQAALNEAFAPEFTGDSMSGQPAYVPMLAGPEPSSDSPPSLIALPVPRPYGRYGPFRSAIESSLPTAVGAFVRWMLSESGWHIREASVSGGRRPLEPRHIAILFRRYMSFHTDMTAEYARALEALDVPHVLVGARSFHRRDEVLALRTAATALEWPDDELSVFGTLRGSLFSIPDHDLLQYRARHGRLHPCRAEHGAEDDTDLSAVREALHILRDLHTHRNDRPIPETLTLLLEATRAHAGFALRPSGEQVLANIHRVIDLARTFEGSGGLSFRGFVEHLAREAEGTSSTETSFTDEDVEGVRIMTVHAAKGLEFPVVILADLTNPLAHENPDRFVDAARGLFAARIMQCAPAELIEHASSERRRDEAEGVRVAYVAATRARDILVVPTLGEGPQSLFREAEKRSWVGPLDKVVYPQSPAAFALGEPAPRCPEFGARSVLGEPESGRVGVSVRPGLHQRPRSEVVWWDPALLEPKTTPEAGLRHEAFLSPGERGSTAASDSVASYHAWQAARHAALERGERLSRSVLSPSDTFEDPGEVVPEGLLEEGPEVLGGAAHRFSRHELSRSGAFVPNTRIGTPYGSIPAPVAYDVEIAHTERGADTPRGRRYGTLVHAIARDVRFTASREEITRLATHHGRMLGADEREVAAAVGAIERLLAHELMERARAAPRRHRELPILFETDDGQTLDGTVDLVFEDGDRLVVVDFKTGEFDEQRESECRRQIAWYMHGLTRSTSREAKGVILVVA